MSSHGVIEDMIRNVMLVNSVFTYVQVCHVSDAVKDIQMKVKSMSSPPERHRR